MRILIIANCTNRKRITPGETVSIRDLPVGSAKAVAAAWVKAVSLTENLKPLTSVYCGRGFTEVLVATKALEATLLIVSAGLGLVDASLEIPNYNATISGSGEDNVLAKLPKSDSTSWWKEVCELSPFSTNLATEAYDLVLIALSRPYFPLIATQLAGLATPERKKIRLFLSISACELPEQLRANLMPYGDRFDHEDGPIPGTKSDFTQRALRHFTNILIANDAQHESAESHRNRIERELENLDSPVRPQRKRLDDREIAVLIGRHWHDAQGGSARMLRYLRDTLGVACEQKRFQGIFNNIREATK